MVMFVQLVTIHKITYVKFLLGSADLGEITVSLRLYHCGFYFYQRVKEGRDVFYTVCETMNPVGKPEEKKKKKGIFPKEESLRTVGVCHTHRHV